MCEEVSFCKIMPCSSLLEEIRSEFVFIVTTLDLCHFVATAATAEENAEGLFVSVTCTPTDTFHSIKFPSLTCWG
jgi:hypothetical protein